MVNMKTCLVILTAGRLSYLDKTIDSLNKNLKGSIDAKFILDNSDGPNLNYDGYKTLKMPSFNLPFSEERHSRVISTFFKLFRQLDYDRFVFFEEDWELIREINIDEMSIHLNKSMQVLLARNSKSIDYHINNRVSIRKDGNLQLLTVKGIYPWTFTWNPSIFDRRIINLEYPIGELHEQRFGQSIDNLVQIIPDYRVESVRHIGIESIAQPAIWDEDGMVSTRIVVE